MSTPKVRFAAVPARATCDLRLTGLHSRVLMATANHDRMSASRGKGQACWASNKTLAGECNCNYSRLSATITDLGRWGYVLRERHPLNKRHRIYRIIYTDADSGFTKVSDSLRTGKGSPDDAVQTVCESANEEGQTVCRSFQCTEQSQQDAGETIFRETEKILGETSEGDSAEAAERGSEAQKALNIGGQLARFERAIKHGAFPEVSVMQQWFDFLEELNATLDRSDPSYGRANRLLEEIDWPDWVRSHYERDEAPQAKIDASGTAQGAMREETNGTAPGSHCELTPDCHSSLAETFPRLYGAFAQSEAPSELMPGDPQVLERLIEADSDQRAEASVVLAREGPKVAAAWIKMNLPAKGAGSDRIGKA